MNTTEARHGGINWKLLLKGVFVPVAFFYLMVTAVNHSMKLVEHHNPVQIDLNSPLNQKSFSLVGDGPFYKEVVQNDNGDIKGKILVDEDGNNFLLADNEKCYVRHDKKGDDVDLSVLRDASFITLYQNYERSLFKTDFDSFCRVYEVK